MPAPICLKCQVEMRCMKNEQLVNDPKCEVFPATYWAGDLFECRSCDAEFVIVNPVTPGRTADEQRTRGRNPDESITFVYYPEQREQYADQFEQRSETP